LVVAWHGAEEPERARAPRLELHDGFFARRQDGRGRVPVGDRQVVLDGARVAKEEAHGFPRWMVSSAGSNPYSNPCTVSSRTPTGSVGASNALPYVSAPSNSTMTTAAQMTARISPSPSHYSLSYATGTPQR